MCSDVKVTVRNTRAEDFPGIIDLSRKVYRTAPPWSERALASHLQVFPGGQFVAEDTASGRIVGMAASLIVYWDDYSMDMSWRDFTDHGMFTNHDPEGRTLYGAEVMVDPDMQGCGVGSQIYEARRALVRCRRLLRIRAGARLRGYHRYADVLTPVEYVIQVVRRAIKDPTLSFQLKHGFVVLGVVPDYLHHDPESLGHAAVIEWINEAVAKPEDLQGRDPRFLRVPEPGNARPQLGA